MSSTRARVRCAFGGCDKTDREMSNGYVSLNKKNRREILLGAGGWRLPRNAFEETQWAQLLQAAKVVACAEHLSDAGKAKRGKRLPYEPGDFVRVGTRMTKRAERSAERAARHLDISHTGAHDEADELDISHTGAHDEADELDISQLSVPRCTVRHAYAQASLPARPWLLTDSQYLRRTGLSLAHYELVEQMLEARGFKHLWGSCGSGQLSVGWQDAVLAVFLRCRAGMRASFLFDILELRISEATASNVLRRALYLVSHVLEQEMLQPWSHEDVEARRHPLFTGV